MTLAERLKNLDAHSSVAKEFRVYTQQGAILSVLTLVLILYLVVTEFVFNFQLTLEERVHVNATSPRGIELEFDLTLPKVPCSYIHVDASDPAGQSQSLHLDKDHHVWKHRVKIDAHNWKSITLLGSKKRLETGSTILDEESLTEHIFTKMEEATAEEDCGSCYGAGEEGECCNTCEDVKRAYKTKGWHLSDLSEIKVCEEYKQGFEDSDEGCNVHGVVALGSGGGNLHIAPGKDFNPTGKGSSDNLLELLMKTYQQWNVSHSVNKLRFGPEYPSIVHQLDGAQRVVEDSSAMYQYYIQVIPTLFHFLNGTVIQTSQYSVTEHVRHISPGSQRGMPGIFFFYEVSPLHVEIHETYRKGWIAFFTSVCAIVGGVVTLMGMIDQWLFSNQNGRLDSLMM